MWMCHLELVDEHTTEIILYIVDSNDDPVVTMYAKMSERELRVQGGASFRTHQLQSNTIAVRQHLPTV